MKKDCSYISVMKETTANKKFYPKGNILKNL